MITAAKYRKRPVTIDAIQWDGSIDVITLVGWWVKTSIPVGAVNTMLVVSSDMQTLTIPTLEGPITAQRGDYIIRGVKGEVYPCKPDIFEMTYERM